MFVCLKYSHCIGCDYEYADRIEDVDEEFRDCGNLKEVDVIRHGKWKINCDGYYPYCSICFHEPYGGKMTKYCPECGAKMDLE